MSNSCYGDVTVPRYYVDPRLQAVFIDVMTVMDNISIGSSSTIHVLYPDSILQPTVLPQHAKKCQL